MTYTPVVHAPPAGAGVAFCRFIRHGATADHPDAVTCLACLVKMADKPAPFPAAP